MNVSPEELNNIDLVPMTELCVQNRYALLGNPGYEPYKFFAFLSTLFNNKVILDVGSYYGNSALAYSYNKNNKVISYDIAEHGQSAIKKDNIVWKIQDFRSDSSLDFSQIKLINIDVDPHDGIQEHGMIQFLLDKKWSGLLLLDDININDPMRNFWNRFSDAESKVNLLEVGNIGHCTGTGLVYFSPDIGYIRS